MSFPSTTTRATFQTPANTHGDVSSQQMGDHDHRTTSKGPPQHPQQQQQQRQQESQHVQRAAITASYRTRAGNLASGTRGAQPQQGTDPEHGEERRHYRDRMAPAATDRMLASRKALGQSIRSLLGKLQEEESQADWSDLVDDVYNLMFLSPVGSAPFFYTMYVFGLKMCLYVFLAYNVFSLGWHYQPNRTTLGAQFVILPVCVAMQDDLIHTYYLVANVNYSPKIQQKHPTASKWKYNFAALLRGVDGASSLFINFIVLLRAESVLQMCVNFAGLLFLTSIDNIALHLAEDGYLGDDLEEAAKAVTQAKLPPKNSAFYKSLDSVLFITTYLAMLITWCVVQYKIVEPETSSSSSAYEGGH